MVTERNVSHTESKRGKPMSKSCEAMGHGGREGKTAAFQILLWDILECLPWYDSD